VICAVDVRKNHISAAARANAVPALECLSGLSGRSQHQLDFPKMISTMSRELLDIAYRYVSARVPGSRKPGSVGVAPMHDISGYARADPRRV